MVAAFRMGLVLLRSESESSKKDIKQINETMMTRWLLENPDDADFRNYLHTDTATP